MNRLPISLACLLCLFLPPWTHAQTPPLPNIPAGNFNVVTSYGAVGDNVTTNTTAIQNAINDASAAGGGMVEIPAGTFLSGPLALLSNINLQLDSGAILRMLPYGSYPTTSPLITVSSQTNLEITGSGIIDGQANFASWWTNNPSLSTSQRPALIAFNNSKLVLVQNITLENPPSMHITFKGSDGNITIQGITINTSGFSPNTDGIDLLGTNVLVENCSISDGDDCIALGSTGGTSGNTMITNCAFGQGHGLSIGSNTSRGVSNLVVANCTFNGTQNGIRMKSDNAGGSPGAGGLVQNLFYYNIGMTNITQAPIVIYSYYNEYGPIGVTPGGAASVGAQTPTSTTVVWRNIIISNVTATVANGGIAGIVWGRTELPATNVVLSQVKITAPASFDVYNVYGFQFANSQIVLPSGTNTFLMYDAGIILTNDTNGTITLGGVTSTNSLALYNASASTTALDLFGADPITVSGGTLTISNTYTPPNPEVFNFALGTNSSTIAAKGNILFGSSTINVTNAAGFGPGTYTLFSYIGSEFGTYTLGSTPTNNFTYALTNTAGQIQFVVSSTGPSLSPVTLVYTNNGGPLKLSWPQDHIGWYLEIQTNAPGKGLGTNWSIVSNSNTTNIFSLPVGLTNGSVFLRLKYP